MRKVIAFAVANPGWTLIIGIGLYYVISVAGLSAFGSLPF